jgi:hypothetical protein
MRKQVCDANAVIVGIFVGGRKSRGKRWDKENFLKLAIRLSDLAVQPVMFVGPEEKDLLAYFERELKGKVPATSEHSHRWSPTVVSSWHAIAVRCILPVRSAYERSLFFSKTILIAGAHLWTSAVSSTVNGPRQWMLSWKHAITS